MLIDMNLESSYLYDIEFVVGLKIDVTGCFSMLNKVVYRVIYCVVRLCCTLDFP